MRRKIAQQQTVLSHIAIPAARLARQMEKLQPASLAPLSELFLITQQVVLVLVVPITPQQLVLLAATPVMPAALNALVVVPKVALPAQLLER